MIDVIEIIVTIMIIASIFPQILRMIREKSVESVSWLFIFLVFIGCVLWLIYGIMKKSIFIIVFYSLIMIIWIMIAYCKYDN